MTAWDGLNRRRFPRVNFPCLVIVKTEESDEEVILTHTENLGVGGLCVVLKKSLKMFSTVSLELDLLDGDTHVHCQGKVVWSIRRRSDEQKKPLFYDTGIEFLDLQDRDQSRILDVVRHLVKKGLQTKPKA